MRVKFKERRSRILSICITAFMLVGMLPFGTAVFADGDLSPDKVQVDSFKIIDEANANMEVDYVTDADAAKYNLYLNDANNFSSTVCQNQTDSQIKLQLVASYNGTEKINEGDTLAIKASYGTFATKTFAEKQLEDNNGNVLGTYKYDQGVFTLAFSGDSIKNNVVTSFTTAALESDSVAQASDEQGLGTGNERKVLVGALNNQKLAVAYELKNAPDAGPGLDEVTIDSFKILDITQGNQEIDYRKSSDADYDTWKNNPAGFGYALNQDQQSVDVVLELAFQYKNSNRALQEGDKLTIPADYGGTIVNFSESSLPLKVTDDTGEHTLGTWKYEKGAFTITFGGEYLRNHNVKNFSAKMSTGKMINYSSTRKKSRILGEKYILDGKLGKDTLAVAAETRYINSNTIPKSELYLMESFDDTSDHSVVWTTKIFNDFWSEQSPDKKRNYEYFNPYFLQNNGQYRPNSATGVYVESTYENCTGEPVIGRVLTTFSGHDNSGKVTEGWYDFTSNGLLTKVMQGSKTKDQVKADLQKGQYCMYDNHDGSYTFMMKWHDMNDPSGAKYNDLPGVTGAGGVGSLLKNKFPDAFGDLSDTSVQKLNNMYDGKALQNIMVTVITPYKTVKEPTVVENKTKITTVQSGEKSFTTKALMLPAGAASETQNNPLSIKLVKLDRYTGDMLSDGFNFELQTSTDGGTTWNKVPVTAAMVKSGTLNADSTVTPVNGVLEIEKLTGGQKYRFVERANPAEYMDTAIDESHHNDATHFTVANSRAVDVKNTGKGHVIKMYNAKLPGITVEGKKELSGRALQDGEFRFQLFEAVTDAKVGDAVSNDAQGKFAKDMTFDHEGTYEFYFAEVNEGKHGITYDDNRVNVTIVVQKNLQGDFVAEVTSGPIVFRNKFTPDPVTVTIEGKKILSGRDLQNGEFRFQLFEKSTDAKVGDAVSNDAQGKFTKDMTFDHEGTYEFYFTEVNDGKEGITYDANKVPVVIEVQRNAQGLLTAAVTSGEVTFSNIFTSKAINPNPNPTQQPGKPGNPNTGDHTNLTLFVMLLALASGALFTTRVLKRKNK